MTIRLALSLSVAIALAALTGCGSGSEPQPSPSAAEPSAIPPTPVATPELAPDPEPEASASSLPAPPSLDHARYAPLDECTQHTGWSAFRKTLASAIMARDGQALARLAAPDVALDYGGGSGSAELVKRLNDPETQLWQELAAILPLGCAMQGGLAAMPWVFWNVPEDTDSYRAVVVLGDDTPLLDKPAGKPVRDAGWTLVDIDPIAFDTSAPATRVTMKDGTRGWIATSKLRSLLDYRLIVEPKDGEWLITAFIAGD